MDSEKPQPILWMGIEEYVAKFNMGETEELLMARILCCWY